MVKWNQQRASGEKEERQVDNLVFWTAEWYRPFKSVSRSKGSSASAQPWVPNDLRVPGFTRWHATYQPRLSLVQPWWLSGGTVVLRNNLLACLFVHWYTYLWEKWLPKNSLPSWRHQSTRELVFILQKSTWITPSLWYKRKGHPEPF